MGILRTKSVEQSIQDTEEPEFQLRQTLGPLDLTTFGIGVIIGTGLFVLPGRQRRTSQDQPSPSPSWSRGWPALWRLCATRSSRAPSLSLAAPTPSPTPL